MANPLSILLGGGSEAHAAREAQMAEASAKSATTPAPQPQATPTVAPAMPQTQAGGSLLGARAATTAPTTGQTGKTMLGA